MQSNWAWLLLHSALTQIDKWKKQVNIENVRESIIILYIDILVVIVNKSIYCLLYEYNCFHEYIGYVYLPYDGNFNFLIIVN